MHQDKDTPTSESGALRFPTPSTPTESDRQESDPMIGSPARRNWWVRMCSYESRGQRSRQRLLEFGIVSSRHVQKRSGPSRRRRCRIWQAVAGQPRFSGVLVERDERRDVIDLLRLGVQVAGRWLHLNERRAPRRAGDWNGHRGWRQPVGGSVGLGGSPGMTGRCCSLLAGSGSGMARMSASV